jgi:hypothetical protein
LSRFGAFNVEHVPEYVPLHRFLGGYPGDLLINASAVHCALPRKSLF